MIRSPGPRGPEPPLDALFVHLPYHDYLHTPSPQLGMLYVATCLERAGFRVGVLDDSRVSAGELVGLVEHCSPAIVGFHVNTDTVRRVRRAARLLEQRSPGRLIVFGGPHVTIDDEALLSEGCGDIVVRGEGEETIVEIASWRLRGEGSLESIRGITYRADGAVVRNRDRETFLDLDRLPEPDMGLLVKEPPFPTYNVISGRGCPFRCAFCAEGLSSIRYRFRSPASVLREIDHLVGDEERVYLGVLDDTFLVSRRRVEEIARGLLERYSTSGRLLWFCEGRVDFINKHPDLFPLLREAGLTRIQIGIESGSQEVLDLYRKRITVEQIESAVAILRDADILSIYGNFIIGGPHENEDTLGASMQLAERLVRLAPGRMECAATILALYPGTAIERDPEAFGLRAVDPRMLRGVSSQHPAAVTTDMDVDGVLDAYGRFGRNLLRAYDGIAPSVPLDLVPRHLECRAYGLTTAWSEMFLRYPSIQTYFGLQESGVSRRVGDCRPDDLLELVPRRTVKTLSAENGTRTLGTQHPRRFALNHLAARTYELCSGKLSVREILEELRRQGDVVPPEPHFSQQITSLLLGMESRLLLVFSDL